MEINERGGILKGVIEIHRENIITGEKEFIHKSHNIIPISGTQWLLMKCFGLYLDSKHDPSNPSLYEDLGRDTTLITPDLNADNGLNIGKSIATYTKMQGNIGENHFVQGFMVGNQGAGEDAVSTKNTDYSYIKLRNPIPFQQTNMDGLNADIAGKYLGVKNISEYSESNPYNRSYYIKRFDERPHIYHSWWRENQDWDYVNPVTPDDLGPRAIQSPQTNRIETYVECKLSLSNDDCVSYFSHQGSNETAMINELGLVAFDADSGARSILENCHDNLIVPLIGFIFDNNRGEDIPAETISLASDVSAILQNIPTNNGTVPISEFGNQNMTNFMNTIQDLSQETVESLTAEKFHDYQDELSSSANINVEAFYNQNGTFIYSTDQFKYYLESENFDGLSTDEAQRIKLFTYYTFNSIPLQKNWRILINYRIYAN